MSPMWWNDLWLNEGFAEYFQYLGVEAIQPQLQFMKQFVIRELHYVLIHDSLESSHSISTHIKYPEESGYKNLFDAITYNKGASLIRMMDAFLTTDTLQKVCKTTEIAVFGILYNSRV